MIQLDGGPESSSPKHKWTYLLPVIIISLLVFIRLALSSRLPPYIISSGVHDDAWCTTRAMYLLEGQWMGPYDQYTLIKGVFAPLLMACSKLIGFSYMDICTYLYCFSCCIFIVALSPVIKSWFLRILIFTVLLFNPITYAMETFQRVYRNGLSQWQILLIFGGIIAIYLRRNMAAKRLLPWAFLSGGALWAFFNTREDGVWLYPFLIVSIIILLITSYLDNKKEWPRKAAVFLIPLCVLVIGNIILCMINQSVYGVALRSDRDDGYYAEVVKDLYLIKPDPEDDALYSSEEYRDQYYNIYVSTVKKAYEVSPTFSTVRTMVDLAIQNWDNLSGLIGDGQPYADHILFAIRDGVAAAGYYQSLPETEAFYKQVHEELQAAFSSGLLEKRGISLTAMAAPLKIDDLPDIFAQIPGTIQYIVSFQGVSTAAIPSVGTQDSIYSIESLTGDRGIVGEKDYFSITGWAFLFSNEAEMTGAVYTSEGDKISDLVFSGGEDVYNYYKSIGMDYASAKLCRFSVSLPGYENADSLYIRTWDSNNPDDYLESKINDILAAGNSTYGSIGFENGIINIDQAAICAGSETLQQSEYSGVIWRTNAVASLYRKIIPPLFLIGILGYFYLWIQLFLDRKKLNQNMLAVLLLLTGLAGSFIVFVGAMCYMTVTTFSAQTYLYLSPAYALLLVFISISVCYALGHIFTKYTR